MEDLATLAGTAARRAAARALRQVDSSSGSSQNPSESHSVSGNGVMFTMLGVAAMFALWGLVACCWPWRRRRRAALESETEPTDAADAQPDSKIDGDAADAGPGSRKVVVIGPDSVMQLAVREGRPDVASQVQLATPREDAQEGWLPAVHG
ncbi:hypothetical protein ABPG77_003802 [Micractinium sp. CCAP 211/92]